VLVNRRNQDPSFSSVDPASPPEINTAVAHPARWYDYWLGGKDNFPADQASGDAVAAAFPTIRMTVVENRQFLVRAVRALTGELGIRQFLDIGTGIPTSPNVHEVAQSTAPDSRVVYVDNDPIVLAHARALLRSGPRAPPPISMLTCASPTRSCRRGLGCLTPADGAVVRIALKV